MDRVQINELYEESVWQIRLRVAIHLLSVPGLDQAGALKEADKFVLALLKENLDELKAKLQ